MDMFNRAITVGDTVIANNLKYTVLDVLSESTIKVILADPSRTTKWLFLDARKCFRITPEEMLLLELTK